MTKLKLSSNKESVLNEIDDGKFNLDFDGYIYILSRLFQKSLQPDCVEFEGTRKR